MQAKYPLAVTLASSGDVITCEWVFDYVVDDLLLANLFVTITMRVTMTRVLEKRIGAIPRGLGHEERTNVLDVMSHVKYRETMYHILHSMSPLFIIYKQV